MGYPEGVNTEATYYGRPEKAELRKDAYQAANPDKLAVQERDERGWWFIAVYDPETGRLLETL